MKKTLAIASIVLMATLTACGGDDSSGDSAADDSVGTSSTPSSSTTSSASPSTTASTSSAASPSTTASTSAGNITGSGDYCAKLQSAKSSLDDLDLTGMGDTQFTELQATFVDVGNSAPTEIADDWDVLNEAIGQFQTILADAGLSLDDLQTITEDPSNLPKGVTLKKLQALGPKLERFSNNSGLEEAGDTISDHAESECGIDLEDSGASVDAPSS